MSYQVYATSTTGTTIKVGEECDSVQEAHEFCNTLLKISPNHVWFEKAPRKVGEQIVSQRSWSIGIIAKVDTENKYYILEDGRAIRFSDVN